MTDRIVIDRVTIADKLRLMRAARLYRLGFAVLVGSCSGGDKNGEPHQAGSAADSSAAREHPTDWVAGTNALILVPAHANDRALVMLADSNAPQLEEGELGNGTLLQLSGGRVPARVVIGTGTEGCVEATLDPAPAASWGAGFVGGNVTAIAVDSLGSIPRADSTALTRVIFRLSSAIPNAKGGRFSGLPFSLVSLWRLRAPDGALVVIGTTKRQINQEDSPLEERTLIVAEGATADSLQTAYSARSSGAEETVDSSDLLAAIQASSTPVMDLVVAHDFGGRISYSLVERMGPRQWRLRWESRKLSC